MQTTLRRPVGFVGTGLHSGRPARLTLRPAGPEHGIWFKRTDVTGRDPLIPALWDAVCDTTLNTCIGNADGVRVATIEHLMAALAGLGVTNALIEIDGPEVPIMDGSARRFAEGIARVGLRTLDAPLRALRILRPVEVTAGDARAGCCPATACASISPSTSPTPPSDGKAAASHCAPTVSAARSPTAAPSAAPPRWPRCARAAWRWAGRSTMPW
ncbi:MAG: hypothetical protein KatS3mg118_0815 [Paracoccaceae bacterium]|nr:MAG: hypothetical protein KatS3mg118_0815 [Paracoccaceae bacterium]